MSKQFSAHVARAAEQLGELARATRLLQLQVAALQRAIEEIHGVNLSTHVRQVREAEGG